MEDKTYSIIGVTWGSFCYDSGRHLSDSFVVLLFARLTDYLQPQQPPHTRQYIAFETSANGYRNRATDTNHHQHPASVHTHETKIHQAINHQQSKISIYKDPFRITAFGTLFKSFLKMDYCYAFSIKLRFSTRKAIPVHRANSFLCSVLVVGVSPVLRRWSLRFVKHIMRNFKLSINFLQYKDFTICFRGFNLWSFDKNFTSRAGSNCC